jgi:Arc/MetJ family transcription regulator
MGRTVMDIDDVLLSEAAKIFGTTTKRATVNAALQAAVSREKQRESAGAAITGQPAAWVVPPGTAD